MLIREVVDLLGDTAASNSVRLEHCPSGDHELMVHADKKRIFRVLSNWTVNAIKFTPKLPHPWCAAELKPHSGANRWTSHGAQLDMPALVPSHRWVPPTGHASAPEGDGAHEVRIG